jgi:hypothetical protein
MKKIIFALVLLVLSASAAMADTVYLHDGRVIRGTVLDTLEGALQFALMITARRAPRLVTPRPRVRSSFSDLATSIESRLKGARWKRRDTTRGQ